MSPSAAGQLAERPYKAPSVGAAQDAAGPHLRPVARHPLQAGDGASGARPGLPFELQFFHPGLYYDQPVRINEIARGQPREIRFDPDYFDYGANKVDQACAVAASASPASACTTRSTRRSTRTRCWCSSARAISARSGKDQRYGLSARGLAIDTGAAVGRGVSALRRVLDRAARRPARRSSRSTRCSIRSASPAPIASCCTPGAETVDRRARRALYLRENVDQARHRAAHQHVLLRREPARRASTTTVPRCTTPTACSIQARHRRMDLAPARQSAAAAGHLVRAHQSASASACMQRDRRFASYQDLEARYELRPSAWVEPRGQVGRRARRAGADPDARRDQRQHRRVLGARRSRRAPKQPFDFEYRLLLAEGQRDARRRSRGSRRRAAATATCAAAGYDDRLHDRLRGPGAEEAAAGRDGRRRRHRRRATARSSRAAPIATTSTGGWRLRAAREAHRRQEARRAARLPALTATTRSPTTWSYILPPE